MSSILNKLFVGAGIVFVGKILIGTISDKLKVKPGAARVNLSSFPAVFRVIWEMEIENKTGINVTIQHLFGEVFFGEIKLSDVSIYQPVTLFAGQNNTVEFVLEIPPITLIGDIVASIIQNGIGTFFNKIRFKGLLKTSLVNVPINMFIPIA